MELTRDEQASALAGAPGVVTIGGESFLIDRYTTSLVFTVYEWALEEARKAFNPIRELAEAMKGLDFPDDLHRAALLEAAKVKLAGDVPGELVTRVLRSPEGVAFQLWALSRTHQPALTHERCRELVTDANRVDVYCQLDRASGANIVVKAVAESGFFPQA